MAFQLPDLPYDFGALQPHIDAKTMEIHHGKHHATYVAGINKALEGQDDLAKLSIVELMAKLHEVPEGIRTAVQNHGGGHLNHCLFWKLMSPNGGGQPSGELKSAIDTTFGGFEAFQTQFNQAAATRFGSGWAWLTIDKDGSLKVESTANQDTPVSNGRTPILGLDVWEHAYYLNYQNRRPDYVGAWWNVVNWEEVARNLAAAKANPGVLASLS